MKEGMSEQDALALIQKICIHLGWDYEEGRGNAFYFCRIGRDFSGFSVHKDLGVGRFEQIMMHSIPKPIEFSGHEYLMVESLGEYLLKMTVTCSAYRGVEDDAHAKVEVALNTPENIERFVGEHCDTIAKSLHLSCAPLLRHSPTHMKEVLLKSMESLTISERQSVSKEIGALGRSPVDSPLEQEL